MGEFFRRPVTVLLSRCQNFLSVLSVPIVCVALTISIAPNFQAAKANKFASFHAASVVPGQKISPRNPAKREIAGSQTQAFIFTLSEGDCLRATLSKSDLNMQVTAFDPAGRKVREFLTYHFGVLTIFFIAATEGLHRLEVHSLEANTKAGTYELQLENPIRATSRNRQEETGRQLSAEAEGLRARWSERDIRAAIEKFREASSAWRLAGRIKEEAATLVAIGECYFTLSEYRQSLSFFKRASAASRAANDRQGEIAALNGAGRVFSYTGEDRQLRITTRRALTLLKRSLAPPDTTDRRAEAEARCHLGEAHYLNGKLPEAQDHFNRALAIWTEAGDRKGQAQARLNLGYVYAESGDLQRATEEYRQALTIWRSVDERRGAALALTAIGGIHSFLSQQAQALDFHRQAQEILHFIGDRQGEASVLNGIAFAYEGLNELPPALDYYTSALNIYRANGSRNSEAVSLVYIGRVHRSAKDTTQAVNHLEQGLALSRKLHKHRVAAYALFELAALDQSASHDDQALNRYRQVLQLYRRIGDRPGQAKALNRIGEVYLTAKQWRQAWRCFQQALPLSQAVQDRSVEVETLSNLGRAARDGGQPDEAFSSVEKAIELIESLRMGASGPGLRASYFASVRKHYELYVDLLMRKTPSNEETAARAFHASESARARTLLDLLAEMKTEIRQGVDPELLTRERELEQLLSAKGQYQIRLLSANAAEKQSAALAEEIRRLSAEYKVLQAQIRQQSPRYATLKQPQPLELWEVQKQLPDDGTLLLEFFLGAERSYLWAVTSRGFTAYELPGRAQIEDKAREVYRLLTMRQTATGRTFEEQQDQIARADQQYTTRAALLSELLLGPVASRLADNKLLIVADGALHYIPFEALPLPRGSLGQSPATSQGGAENFVPLVARHEVVSLPSASALAAIRQATPTQPRASRGVFVFADPVFEPDDPRVIADRTMASRTSVAKEMRSDLPNGLRDAMGNSGWQGLSRLPATQQEANEIIASAPSGQWLMATGFDASRVTVMKADLQQYRIVHFATHGLISFEHPELSGIVLSMVDRQGNKENGFLQLHDIYNLRLSAELVTLSACSTGLGKEVSGEGLVGLTQGFMYAGTKRVLTSLWKVDDKATAELMQRFYREQLVEKKSPAAALRVAKMELWRKGRWQAPFYWAAFVLQGDPTGVITLTTTSWHMSRGLYLFILLFLALLACVFTYKLAKKRTNRERIESDRLS